MKRSALFFTLVLLLSTVLMPVIGSAAVQNSAPILSSVGGHGVNEGALLQIQLSATDPDEDTVTYTISGSMPGSSFDTSTGLFTWTPDFTQSGFYNVTFGATDGSLSATEDTFISVNNVDRAPVLSRIGDKTVKAGTLLTFTTTATDPDGDTVTFSSSGLPSGATFDTGTGIFNWTPTTEQVGSYSEVTFQASSTPPRGFDEIQGPTLTASESITITVNQDDRAPVLNPIGARSTTAGVTVLFTVTGSDPDGDRVTFSVLSLPSGATFEPSTGVFSWTPLVAGNETPTFTITSGNPPLSAREQVSITVSAAPSGGGGPSFTPPPTSFTIPPPPPLPAPSSFTVTPPPPTPPPLVKKKPLIESFIFNINTVENGGTELTVNLPPPPGATIVRTDLTTTALQTSVLGGSGNGGPLNIWDFALPSSLILLLPILWRMYRHWKAKKERRKREMAHHRQL